jgi:AAA15 family ATPase/GTPase
VIERIRIENFRLFKNFEMNGVKQINLISGANNVGKTSLLEAIMLSDSENDPKNIFKNRKHFSDSIQKIDFADFYNNKNRNVRGIMGARIDDAIIEFITSLDEESSGLQLYTKYIRDVYDLDKLCEYFGPIATNYEKLEKLVVLLQELEPRINDLRIGVEDNTPYIIANVGLPQGLSMSSLGDGINKLLTILLTALRDDCKILLLDEIETGFHYSFYPKLWSVLSKLAKETGCQIFATTHSYECIEGAKELNQNEPEMFGFFRLTRDEDNIICKAFENDVFEYSLEHNWEVR